MPPSPWLAYNKISFKFYSNITCMHISCLHVSIVWNEGSLCNRAERVVNARRTPLVGPWCDLYLIEITHKELNSHAFLVSKIGLITILEFQRPGLCINMCGWSSQACSCRVCLLRSSMLEWLDSESTKHLVSLLFNCNPCNTSRGCWILWNNHHNRVLFPHISSSYIESNDLHFYAGAW